MYIIRPANINDLRALTKLAFQASMGMLALPKNRELLKKRITRSQESVTKKINTPKRELDLVVLEKDGRIGGTCSIYSKIGVKEPVYFFSVEKEILKSKKAPVQKRQRLLHSVSLTNGPTEIGGLYLIPQWRKEGLGKFLSLTRFLFMAEHINRFDNVVIGRLKGDIDIRTKRSPFWEWVGKNFLKLDLEDVFKKLETGRLFIEDFIPKHPIYISLLPKNIQNSIGKISPNTKPALTILQKQNFKLMPDVDIFDAGPIMAAKVKDIRTVKLSKTSKVLEITENPVISKKYIISTGSLKNFRSCLGNLKITKNREIIMENKAAFALKIKQGDLIRYYPLSTTRP